MALPPPPKYRRLMEERDSKHALKERAKKNEARARAIQRMKELEIERERDRRMAAAANRPTTTIDPFNDVVFYVG